MPDESKTVFISYRRHLSSYIARAVFQDLSAHGFDVFMDVESIDAGTFDTIILNQIAARVHFIVILTTGSLEPTSSPSDWFWREIDYAIALQRNIIPILANGFHFDEIKSFLTGNLKQLPRYNAITLHHDYFEEAMERLRSRFLKRPMRGDLRTTSPTEWPHVLHKVAKVIGEPAPTMAELTAEEHYSQAIVEYRKEDYHAALEYCNKAIALNPSYVMAYSLRGAVYDALGNWEQALADCTTAIQLAPQYTEAYINRGVTYDHLGDHPHALENYAIALRLDPNHAQAYYYRGLVYDHEGKVDQAIADYTEAIRLRPDYALAYQKRGELYHRQGQYDRAADDLRRARELDAQD
ncbi:MAG: tetratricopeptide repeat protein [Chloroflexi bacterium]|nr:tetratricopeptide repeat protein [Chloroflexota bacterium]